MKALPNETRTRRTIRDLVALSTLPAIWVNYQPLQVAQSLAEVLQSTLGLDLVYLRLRGQADGGAIEVARTGRRTTEAGQAEEIGRALTPWLDRAHTNSVVSVPNPVGSGTVRIVRIPIGWEGEEWVLVAGSQHADFPTDEERSLLSVGANQAAMMLQRKQAEETLRASEGRFCGTFENAAGGIANTDRQGGFLRVNDKLCDIVGYTREELLERSFVEITHPDFLPANLELYARLWRSEIPSFTAEKRYIRKDGSLVWCEVTVSLQCDATGAPAYAIAVIKDVSDRKRLEAELRLAKEAAEAANRAKDEFLANVSHEIRTPFGAILGMTELVLETPLNEDQRECLEIAKSAADSLLGIINDLLDFEKIEAGKLELDPSDFSLREVLLDTLQTMVVRAQAKGIELVCDIHPDAPDALVGDAGRLRQVLINLISNAIKFTIHGQVAVRVKVDDGPAPQGVALLCFMVSDTGIGIPPEGRERIFRAFEQAESTTTRRYGGTGLGLTIAARLVSLMGGTINVESEPGRGSTFFFTARFGQQPHSRERVVARPSDVIHEAAMPTRLAAPLRILAAEDSQLNSRHLERLLTRRGHTVRVATDGREALDLAIEGAFDLLLLDLHMPELDGFQVVRAIRLREHTTGGACRLSRSRRAQEGKIVKAASRPAWTTTSRSRSAPWSCSQPSTEWSPPTAFPCPARRGSGTARASSIPRLC